MGPQPGQRPDHRQLARRNHGRSARWSRGIRRALPYPAAQRQLSYSLLLERLHWTGIPRDGRSCKPFRPAQAGAACIRARGSARAARLSVAFDPAFHSPSDLRRTAARHGHVSVSRYRRSTTEIQRRGDRRRRASSTAGTTRSIRRLAGELAGQNRATGWRRPFHHLPQHAARGCAARSEIQRGLQQVYATSTRERAIGMHVARRDRRTATYGTAVNLAGACCGEAESGSILVTELDARARQR